MDDPDKGLRERRRRLVQELTGHGLVRLGEDVAVALGVTQEELQPVVEWARLRWAYALTVPRSLATQEGRAPKRDLAELWLEPWAVVLLRSLAQEHPALAVAQEQARARMWAAHLHHAAEGLSDEVRRALVVVDDLAPNDRTDPNAPTAAQEYLRARGAFTTNPKYPDGSWHRAIARVRSQEVPRFFEGPPPGGEVRVW